MKRLVTLLLAAVLAVVALPASAHSRAAQPPSIPACTDIQFAAMTGFITDAGDDMQALSDAMNAFDLDKVKETAITLHTNWFEASPDMPYCAQAVHTRLLMDRTIEALTIGALLTVDLDLDNAAIYNDMLTTTLDDLTTYQQIIQSYAE